MQINKHHGKYNIVRRSSKPTYIVCHYTGSGTSKAGSALANCKYFARANRNASAHYFIDDSGIWEYADPSTYTTWHCGDGHGKYGITNSNSIGIEVCMNGNNPYTQTEIDYLKQLVQHLMSQFGIPADHVVRHYDASRKRCPYYYTPAGTGGNAAWSTLRAYITGGNVKPASSGSTSSSSTSSGLGDLRYWGPKFTREMQRQRGTTVDGIVSNQPTSNKKWLVNADTSSWEFTKNYKGGSKVMRSLQSLIGAGQDGWFGYESVGKLQEWLNKKGFKLDVDHYMGPATCTAVGQGLQRGIFR